MNEVKNNNLGHFYDYYSKGDETKRLSFLLLIFAFLLCPFFAFIFKFVGAPDIVFYITFSATFCFPLILFLEKVIPILNGKLPYLYFTFFNLLTLIYIYDLYLNKFNQLHLTYLVGLFAVLNFALQRSKLSLIYFLNVIVFLLVAYYLSDSLSFINFFSIFTLICCIGIFFLVLFKSRDKLILRIQDHNNYLQQIVNKLGTGVLFTQIENNRIKLLDINEDVHALFKIENAEEIENLLQENFDSTFLMDIQNLEQNKYLVREINFKDGRYFEFKFTKIELNSQIYFLTNLLDISAKRRENKKILANEKKYKNLFIRNKNPLFSLNEKGQLIEFNPAFLGIFPECENPNSKFQLFTTSEFKLILNSLKRNDVITNYEKNYKEDTDNLRNLIFNFYLNFESGIIEGNITDMTEYNKSAKALLENENKYRLIFEESNDTIVLLDEDRIIHINNLGLELFGTENYEEKSLWDFTYQQNQHLKEEYDTLFKKLKIDKNIKFPWTFRKNNSFIEVSISIVELLLDEEILYQCVIRDETERNFNLRQIEQSKKSFESIFENTPEGFLILRENTPIFANKEFYKIFNIENQIITDLKLDEQFFGLNFPKFQSILESHREDKQIKQKTLKFFLNKKAVEIDLTFVSIIFEKQEATLLILKDVSYQIKLSKEVLRAELAEESNKKLEKEILERISAEKKLESEYIRTNAIFESSKNTILLTFDSKLTISSFNSKAKDFLEFQTAKEIEKGINLADYLQEIISKVKIRYLRKLTRKLNEGKSFQYELKFTNLLNEKKWIELYLNPIFDVDGILTEISLVAHDISEKKKYEQEILTSLKEKEVLLKEVHHRVKNNLQIISSILNLQSSYVEDEKVLEIIDESRHRIRSMSIIHENLYQNTNFSSIGFDTYIKELISNLIASYSYSKKLEIDLIQKLDKVELGLDQAIPCGLIINEIITNTMKYAFPNQKKGKIYLELIEKNSKITLVVGDNGVGLPENYDINSSETLGLQLVVTLIEQLDGELKLETKQGIKYFITFEKQKL